LGLYQKNRETVSRVIGPLVCRRRSLTPTSQKIKSNENHMSEEVK
jgi:hypothetical protein